jgi:Tfp pilus assembly protein PilO
MIKQGKLSRPAAIAVIVGGDLLLLVLGWFLLVGPQRSTAASIARATQAEEAQIVEAEAAVHRAPAAAEKQPEIKTAALYGLAKAMPETEDMPDLLLELDQVARDAGVTVSSVTPTAANVDPLNPTPYTPVPITLQCTGNFFALTDLLYRLNGLVTVRDGELDATGRLFSVESVSITQNNKNGPLTANITLQAYTYGSVAAAAAAPTPATTTSSTTDTTTTSASSSSDVAPNP